jgi:phage terminase large subunit-like protein
VISTPGQQDFDRWRDDPAAFVEEVLVDPETGRNFRLNQAERDFLGRAFELTGDGRLKYPELIYSAPKKSGKTGFAAMMALYVVTVLGGRYAEGFCCANDLEQAQGRVFQAIRRIVEASPILAQDASITAGKVEFLHTGSTIVALASDYAGAAGSNPTITVFDELWGYTSERAHRLWDEQVPPPTRRIACRLTVTYAGYEHDSELLEALYRRGLAGEEVAPALYAQPGMLMFWTHEFVADWQTPEWREQMRGQLRANAFLRLIENRWVSSESSFVDLDWWDACVDSDARPVLANLSLPVWVGVDASTKRDSTAIAVCAWDHATKRACLVWHRIFQPSPTDPLDFEATIETSLLQLRDRFMVESVRYDPWQMQAVAQRLQRAGLPMEEFPQTVSNLTAASTNLYELVKGRNLAVYQDAEIRLAVQRAVALETPRGWRITKEKASHKIDIVIALAMAALGAVQVGQSSIDINQWRAFGEGVQRLVWTVEQKRAMERYRAF